MQIIKISDRLSVAPQPDLRDFEDFRNRGFTSVVNARPDKEEANQPGNAGERNAAEQAGLRYSFNPVTVATITEADIQAFQDALAEADGPVLAHCKSGLRAAMLHTLGRALDGEMRPDDIPSFGHTLGFDLSPAVKWLEKHLAQRPHVKGFFDPCTSSIQYVVSDPDTGKCAIIDPVLDFDEKSGATSTRNADAILTYISEKGLTVEWILDTHPHADHFSAAHYLQRKIGAPMAIGEHVAKVHRIWKDIYNWPDIRSEGPYWDRFFAEGEAFQLGSINTRILYSPGHTLASITYLIGNAAFVHDTMFMPDGGTARADFPGGDARTLWRSIQDILALPEGTRLFTGHDYQPAGRTPRWESTVGEQKHLNHHIAGSTEQQFVALREARDRTLPMPKLILHALQVNLRGGRLPDPEGNGRRYLKFPLNALTDDI